MYDSDARVKGVAIVRRLRDAVDRWKEETGYGFSLYSTPSENLCDRFCRLDTAEFGVIEGVTDKGYYTNSFHLDVEKRLTRTTRSTSKRRIRRWPTGLHLLRRIPEYPAQPESAGRCLGLQLPACPLLRYQHADR